VWLKCSFDNAGDKFIGIPDAVFFEADKAKAHANKLLGGKS
jgi:hypothetical protein